MKAVTKRFVFFFLSQRKLSERKMSRLSGKESAEKKIVGKKFLSRFRLQILKIALDVEK